MKTRIVFFGTPEFATATLEALRKAQGMEVVAIVTAPDKPAGRGLTLKASHIAENAGGIPLFKPTRLKDPLFLDLLQKLQADVFVVVAFRMLPTEVWSMPTLGTFNVHASLLPHYRGAAPIQWALANGESVTGVTTFLLNERIDEGQILLQQELNIAENEAMGTLYSRLMEAGALLAVATVKGLKSGNIVIKTQKTDSSARLAPKIYPQFGQLELLITLDEIHHRIRACDPFPGASVCLQSTPKERIKLFNSEYVSYCISSDYTIYVKLIISDNEVHLVQGKGVLKIHDIQWPGKRKMNTSEFLRGFRLRGEFALDR
ncbi:MAG: methionyl-tRNA formyltransferase [Cryomorphaceae bacterium]|nr:methionyl-tRNA formyltransferase [Cryomorphaceae bacterium]